jgi:hypothetical protein
VSGIGNNITTSAVQSFATTAFRATGGHISDTHGYRSHVGRISIFYERFLQQLFLSVSVFFVLCCLSLHLTADWYTQSCLCLMLPQSALDCWLVHTELFVSYVASVCTWLLTGTRSCLCLMLPQSVLDCWLVHSCLCLMLPQSALDCWLVHAVVCVLCCLSLHLTADLRISNSNEQSFLEAATTLSYSRNCAFFMESEGSLSFSEEPSTGPCSHPN